jgi:hypothetical protein
VDSYQIDSEWKKRVKASMLSLKDGQDNTLKVLRQLLSKLDTPTGRLLLPGSPLESDQVEEVPNLPAQSRSVHVGSDTPRRNIEVNTAPSLDCR